MSCRGSRPAIEQPCRCSRASTAPISILAPNFQEEVDKLRSEDAKASEMEHAIRHIIRVRLDENPEFYGSLKRRLEAIIETRRQERIQTAQAVLQLQALVEEVRGVRTAAGKLGLSETEFAFYETPRADLNQDGDDPEPLKALA